MTATLAVPNTYGLMQARIADEVLGSPTPLHIQNAIQDAIGTYERESFWFNDMRTFGDLAGSLSDLQTNSGQEFYSAQDLPSLVTMPHIRNILCLAFANRYPLRERTAQWIDEASLSTSWQGLPTDWCWQAGALRLYPVPNGGYPLIVNCTTRFPTLVNTGDYNCWTNEAEPLIRWEAKRLLFTSIIRDDAMAALCEREVFGNPQLGREGYLAQLRRETMRRAGGTGRIRASAGFL